MEIIDLSQEIYSGMPVFKGHPEVKVTVVKTHEESEGLPEATWKTSSLNKLEMGEHTGTHVDALSHMRKENSGQSIEAMPLSMFYTPGICIDLSHISGKTMIDRDALEKACFSQDLHIHEGDTVLLYTDHYRKFYGTENWANGPGLSEEATRWLGNFGIVAFGVETMSPGIRGISNRGVHRICGEMGFTHYENLMNLNLLAGRGRFRFIALPLKIRGGTGSPVRAIAVFE